jgi:hypothetical protein
MNEAKRPPEPLTINGELTQVGKVVATCRGCGEVRTFYPDAPLVGWEAQYAWTSTNVPDCAACGPKAALEVDLVLANHDCSCAG